MRPYWVVWALTTAWCVVIVCAVTLIVVLCTLIPAGGWPIICWAAGGLAFTAYLSFLIWLGQGGRK